MSTRRLLAITVFAALIIIVLVGVMLLTSYRTRDNDVLQLPDTSASTSTESPGAAEQDVIDRVEATRDTIQAIISTLSRPDQYSRDVMIENFWKDGHTEYSISVAVADGVTSIRALSPVGVEKRIIVASDTLYIWYKGDTAPYIGDIGSLGDDRRTSDEWQMLITYEDVIKFDKNDITDAGCEEYDGKQCVYAVCRSPFLGYTRKYFISLDLGLLVGAQEYDETGALVYSMTAGEYTSEVDPSLFILPDGTVIN